MKQFFKEKKKVILGLFLLTFFTYFIKLFFYSISIDTERMILSPKETIYSWYMIGRYTLGFFKSFINLVCFHVTLANWISMILLYLSSLVFIFSFYQVEKSSQKSLSYFILGAIFITSPLVAEQFNFTLQTVEISLCYLLEAISFLWINQFILKKKYGYLVPAIICNVLCIGAYQSFVNFFICIATCFYLLLIKEKDWDFKNAFIVILKYIFILFLSFGLSQIISKLVLQHFHINRTSSYLTSQIFWGTKSISNILFYITYYGVTTLTGKGVLYQPYYLITITIVFFYMSYQLHKKEIKFITQFLPMLFLFVSPYLLSIILGHEMAARAFFSLPFVLGFLIFYMMKESSKKIFPILGMIIILHQFLVTSLLFISDYNRYQEELQLVQSITKDIKKYDLEKPLIFLGKKGFTKKDNVFFKGETLGYSFFEWDFEIVDGSNHRIHGLLKTLGYQLQEPNSQQIAEAKKYQSELKVYPEKGSIKETEQYIILKLSNE